MGLPSFHFGVMHRGCLGSDAPARLAGSQSFPDDALSCLQAYFKRWCCLRFMFCWPAIFWVPQNQQVTPQLNMLGHSIKESTYHSLAFAGRYHSSIPVCLPATCQFKIVTNSELSVLFFVL